MSKKGRRKKRRTLAQTAPAKPLVTPASRSEISEASKRLLLRLTVYQASSGVLFALLAIPISRHWQETTLRFERLPGWVKIAISTAMLLSVGYRFFHAATRNHRLKATATNEAALRKYAIEQSVSTVISLVIATSVTFYISGLLDPVTAQVSVLLSIMNPGFIDALTAVIAAVFWGVVTNALWDLIKWSFSRKGSRTG